MTFLGSGLWKRAEEDAESEADRRLERTRPDYYVTYKSDKGFTQGMRLDLQRPSYDTVRT